uniref:Uncharacterized protein n=1 Tax=Rhizophora mucronata TaxID=61149 RepID=A0A2P2PLF4_RHIMU
MENWSFSKQLARNHLLCPLLMHLSILHYLLKISLPL